MIQRKLILSGVAATVIGGASVVGVSHAFAQTAPSQYPSIVQKIADRFGLNVNDVKAVFDQNFKDKQAQREAQFEQRLDQAVSAGKLTAAQKQLILQKRQEMSSARQAQFKNFQTMTPAQRQATRQQMFKQRQDTLSWAKQNGIDPQYLFGFGRQFGGFRGRGWKTQSPQQ